MEPSLEDPLEECFSELGYDIDLNHLLEEANVLLESKPMIKIENGETT